MEVLGLGEKCREQEKQEGWHVIRGGKAGAGSQRAGDGSRPRARWGCGSGEESGALTSELEAPGSGSCKIPKQILCRLRTETGIKPPGHLKPFNLLPGARRKLI